MSLPLEHLFMIAAGLVVLGLIGLAVWGLSAEASPLRRLFTSYARQLQESQELLLSRTTGRQIAFFQLALVPGVVAVGLFLGPVAAVMAIGAVAILPRTVQVQRVKKRRAALAKQVEGWTLLLSSALKATGSIADAVAATGKLTSPPISEEIDLVLKELQLGTPLDRALRRVATRVDGAEFESAVLALVVGRQTGGDVPRLLETLASTLRERERVEGTVRKELAGAKRQLVALALAPPVVLIGVLKLIPSTQELWFRTQIGQILLVVFGLVWVYGFIAAWRVLRVDV